MPRHGLFRGDALRSRCCGHFNGNQLPVLPFGVGNGREAGKNPGLLATNTHHGYAFSDVTLDDELDLGREIQLQRVLGDDSASSRGAVCGLLRHMVPANTPDLEVEHETKVGGTKEAETGLKYAVCMPVLERRGDHLRRFYITEILFQYHFGIDINALL